MEDVPIHEPNQSNIIVSLVESESDGIKAGVAVEQKGKEPLKAFKTPPTARGLAMTQEKGCGEQMPHRDICFRQAKLDAPAEFERRGEAEFWRSLGLGVVVCLDGYPGATIRVWPGTHKADEVSDWTASKLVVLKPGQMFVFSMLLVHAGGAYVQEHMRLHWYVPGYWNTSGEFQYVAHTDQGAQDPAPGYWNTSGFSLERRPLKQEPQYGFTGIPLNQWEYLKLRERTTYE